MIATICALAAFTRRRKTDSAANRRPSLHVVPRGPRATAQHYIRDLVYGANDGIITTFAVVACVAGGSLSTRGVLIVGAANLLADGLSMGAGNYLGIRAEEGSRELQGLPEAEASPVIGGHPDKFAAILHHVGPGARVCLDTGHTFLDGFTQRFIELAGDRLVHVHAHDNHGRYDDHVAPGDGAIDWATLTASLAGARYAGWFVLELKCSDTPMAEYFRRARHQLEHLQKRVPVRVDPT